MLDMGMQLAYGIWYASHGHFCIASMSRRAVLDVQPFCEMLQSAAFLGDKNDTAWPTTS